MKSSIFWDIKSCGPSKVNPACCLLYIGFLSGFFFGSADEADILLLNVGWRLSY
jgi:hypothetical protein